VLVHDLPDGDREITAINFGSTPIDESITVQGVADNAKAVDVLDPQSAAVEVDVGGKMRLQLQGYEGRAYRIAK
jgi:hypothetical protein